MPFDFRHGAPEGKICRHKTGRPRLDPAAPLSGAERAARYRAKHQERINRERREERRGARLLGRLEQDINLSVVSLSAGTEGRRALRIGLSACSTAVNVVSDKVETRHSRKLLAIAEFDHIPVMLRGQPALRLRKLTVRAGAPRGAEGMLLHHGCPILYRCTRVPVFFAEGWRLTLVAAGWVNLWEEGRPVCAQYYGRGRAGWRQSLGD